MHAVVSALVALVVVRLAEVEVVHIGIHVEYAEEPVAGSGVDGAVEVVHTHEAAVLRSREYPAEVVVAVVQELVVAVYGRGISAHHIVHDVTDIVDKVVVHLVCIVVLHLAEVEFVGHTVGDEAGVLAYFTAAHCAGRKGNHEHHQCHPKGSQLFHIFLFFKFIRFFLVQK